jgi:hypothetical protein
LLIKGNYIMKNLLTTTALAVIMISPAFAGERTVTVPTPKSITLVCSDDVAKGTVVLTNPPKFSCEDYETITSVVGLGITVGPDTKVQEISAAINRANRKEKRKSRIQSVSREGNTSTYKMNSGNTVKWTDPTPDVPVVKAPTTPIKVRPEGWKDSPFVEESRPIPQPTFRTYSQKDYDARDKALQSLYSAMGVEDERSSWKTISADEYENFDGQSRNKKFFRD